MRNIMAVLAALILSVVASYATAATYYQPASPQPAASPSTMGFFMGVEGFYWQPSNSDLDYGIVDPNNDSYPHGQTAQIDPNRDFGFRVNGGIRFNTNDDLSASYTYFHTSDSGSKNAPSGGVIWTSLVHPDFGMEKAEHAKGKIEFDYDVVDIMLGHQMHITPHIGLHLAAGLRYAEIATMLKADYTGFESSPRIPADKVHVALASDYKGIGPRFTATGTYDIGAGFSFVANCGMSLLMGNSDLKAKQTSETYPSEPVLNSIKSTRVDVKKPSYETIVPELDGRLGFLYTYKMQNEMSFSVHAGWEVMNYFNVRDRLQFHDDNEGAFDHNETNLAFNGPYLGITFTA